MFNGFLDRRICFLTGVKTFPMIGLLLDFFTPGKFLRIYSGYLCWEHIYSSHSLGWIFAINKTSRQYAFVENSDDR
jgi:hypothetical protein